jgi:hypothetical protein
MDGRKGNPWVWVGIAVVVIGAVLFLVLVAKPPPEAPNTSTSEGVVSNPTPVYAPSGTLTPQFPKELILDSSAQVSESYSINYSLSTNQYTAQWVSSMSVAALYAAYSTYLSSNGWTITNHGKSSLGASLYATKDDAVVNVVITPHNAGSQVVISYVGE